MTLFTLQILPRWLIRFSQHLARYALVLGHQCVLVRSLETSNGVTAVSTLWNVTQTQAALENSLHKLEVIKNQMSGLQNTQNLDSHTHVFQNQSFTFKSRINRYSDTKTEAKSAICGSEDEMKAQLYVLDQCFPKFTCLIKLISTSCSDFSDYDLLKRLKWSFGGQITVYNT